MRKIKIKRKPEKKGATTGTQTKIDFSNSEKNFKKVNKKNNAKYPEGTSVKISEKNGGGNGRVLFYQKDHVIVKTSDGRNRQVPRNNIKLKKAEMVERIKTNL